MTKSDEEIFEETNEDEFDLDLLSPADLDSIDPDEETEFVHPPRRNPQIFLARMQWWSFGILVGFIIVIILRMIFGPPWLDRFLYPRPPVAIDSANGLIGVIIPESPGDYFLYLVDTNGGIRAERNLGRIVPGPVDLAMSSDHYFFMYGEGSWIAGRPFVPAQRVSPENHSEEGEPGSIPYLQPDVPLQTQWLDVDLNQFNVKFRDGIDLLDYGDGEEYLTVFNEDTILVLMRERNLWRKSFQFDPKNWKESYWQINELTGNLAIVSSGSGFELLDFPNESGNYSNYENSTFIQLLKSRPHFPGEYIYSLYKPASISTPTRNEQLFDFIMTKNDRMFNLPYKMADDQVFKVYLDRNEFVPFNHPYFARKDIRALVVVDDPQSSGGESNGAEIVILYEVDSTFRLAGLKMEKAKPLWDILLGKVAEVRK
jgi:hypothetical protein